MKQNLKKEVSPFQAMADNLINDMYKVTTEITKEGFVSVSSLLALANTAYQFARYCTNRCRVFEKECLAK